MVVSDHSGHNLPQGLLVLEDSRRLSQLRGIAIPDRQCGSKLCTRRLCDHKSRRRCTPQGKRHSSNCWCGCCQYHKGFFGNAVVAPIIKTNILLASPGSYESTLISIMKVGFDGILPCGNYVCGQQDHQRRLWQYPFAHRARLRLLQAITLFPTCLTTQALFSILRALDTLPQALAEGKCTDVTVLTATPPKIAAVVITGYLVDPAGTDANYEYIQCLATRNIDFAVTNFSVVTTNNAGTSTPINYPTTGWATGDLRTYKFDLTSGTVARGEYFYIGGNKNIWGCGFY
jgi:hypothetical protein